MFNLESTQLLNQNIVYSRDPSNMQILLVKWLIPHTSTCTARNSARARLSEILTYWDLFYWIRLLIKILPNAGVEQGKGLEEPAADTHQILWRVPPPYPSIKILPNADREQG